MHFDRVLSPEENIYVDRAQQKIAELGAALAEEYSRNDIDDYKAQLSRELQYSIEVLKSTNLSWTVDQIQEMMDYYTIQGQLNVYAFVGFHYAPISGGGSSSVVYATIEQLNKVEQDSIDRDAALQAGLDQEILDRIAGDLSLQNQIDLLGVGGALTIEITSQVNLGAIYIGQVFPIGTPMEDIWVLALQVAISVDNFTFDSYAAVNQVGVGFNIAQFTWDVVGVPTNMKLSDSEGIILNQPVSGNSYTPGAPVNYPLGSYGPITWTLTADNMDPVTISVDVWYLNYYRGEPAVDDTPVIVVEADILGGISQLGDTATEVTRLADTGNNEQGFIAVHKAQSGADYTKWRESGANQSNIASGDFINLQGDVIVNGQTYRVYRWGYRSPLNASLTLYR